MLMFRKGKNTAIARPRPAPPRPIKSETIKANYKEPASVMNSMYQSNTFGTPNSSNRKLDVYTKPDVIKSDISNSNNLTRRQKKHGVLTSSQARVEAKVGQMDRLARLKAAAIKNSK